MHKCFGICRYTAVAIDILLHIYICRCMRIVYLLVFVKIRSDPCF